MLPTTPCSRWLPTGEIAKKEKKIPYILFNSPALSYDMPLLNADDILSLSLPLLRHSPHVSKPCHCISIHPVHHSTNFILSSLSVIPNFSYAPSLLIWSIKVNLAVAVIAHLTCVHLVLICFIPRPSCTMYIKLGNIVIVAWVHFHLNTYFPAIYDTSQIFSSSFYPFTLWFTLHINTMLYSTVDSSMCPLNFFHNCTVEVSMCPFVHKF